MTVTTMTEIMSPKLLEVREGAKRAPHKRFNRCRSRVESCAMSWAFDVPSWRQRRSTSPRSDVSLVPRDVPHALHLHRALARASPSVACERTGHPHAAWAAQQMVEAVGPEVGATRLIRDRDGIYGAAFDKTGQWLGPRAGANRADVTLAERLRREIRRDPAPRVARPRDRARRTPSAPLAP